MLDSSRLWARIIGLGVAAIVAVAATQLLTLGFETEPLVSRTAVSTVTDWVRRPPQPGAGILAAIAVVLGGIAALLGGLWPRRGSAAIITRRRDGWTRIDRKSLQDAIERRLETVDRRSNVKTRVSRSGRIDLAITSIDTDFDGPPAKLRDAVEDLCDQRQLPCRAGTITIKARPPGTRRRRNVE
jgi:hypothetical protein